MKDHVIVQPCAAPPVSLARHQRGIEWFQYQVATASGRSDATGYVPGPEENAWRKAYAALNSLQRAEGVRLTQASMTAAAPVAPVRKGHDSDCLCRRCSNERYKQRVYRTSVAKKARARGQPRRYGFHNLEVRGVWSTQAGELSGVHHLRECVRKAAYYFGRTRERRFTVKAHGLFVTVERTK